MDFRDHLKTGMENHIFWSVIEYRSLGTIIIHARGWAGKNEG